MLDGDKEVRNTIELWMEHGEFLITNATPFAAETIATFLEAMDEDGDFRDLVRDAKKHFQGVFPDEW